MDFIKYAAPPWAILFLSPYQNFKWLGKHSAELKLLQFHGDFYCIEYHKKEVACNGLLFNNIYLRPYISLNEHTFQELGALVEKMKKESFSDQKFSDSVLKSYLQLILAICSKEKAAQLDADLVEKPLVNVHKIEGYFHEWAIIKKAAFDI